MITILYGLQVSCIMAESTGPRIHTADANDSDVSIFRVVSHLREQDGGGVKSQRRAQEYYTVHST